MKICGNFQKCSNVHPTKSVQQYFDVPTSNWVYLRCTGVPFDSKNIFTAVSTCPHNSNDLVFFSRV